MARSGASPSGVGLSSVRAARRFQWNALWDVTVASQAFRLSLLRRRGKLVEEFQADGLEDVGSVLRCGVVLARNGVDELFVLANQRVPSALVTL